MTERMAGRWIGDTYVIEGRVQAAGDFETLTNHTRLSDIGNRMTTAEGEIDTLQSDLDTAEGEIDTLQSEMDTAQSDIDTAEAAIVALQDAHHTLLRQMIMQAFADNGTALWIPRYASDADEALTDMMGNGNDLNYDHYDDADWSKANGWAGSAAGYFDTGILPQLEQTIYVAFTNVVNPNNNAAPIGVRQSISGTVRNHLVRIYTEATDDHRCAFMGTADGVTPRVQAGVLAMNKNGFWLNGVEFSAQSISTSYAFTTNLFLMAINNLGSPGDYFNDGHIAAAAIVNATDTDSRIFQRSRAMMELIGSVV